MTTTHKILKEFGDHLDTYIRHRNFILKAREKAGRFSASVVEKVVRDHEARASQVAEELQTLVPQLEQALLHLEEEWEELEGQRTGYDLQLQELLLRLDIEELNQKQYDEGSEVLRAHLDEVGEKLKSIRCEIEAVRSALDAWVGQSAW